MIRTTVISSHGARPRPVRSLTSSITRFRAECRRVIAAEQRSGVCTGIHPSPAAYVPAHAVYYFCCYRFEPTAAEIVR